MLTGYLQIHQLLAFHACHVLPCNGQQPSSRDYGSLFPRSLDVPTVLHGAIAHSSELGWCWQPTSHPSIKHWFSKGNFSGNGGIVIWSSWCDFDSFFLHPHAGLDRATPRSPRCPHTVEGMGPCQYTRMELVVYTSKLILAEKIPNWEIMRGNSFFSFSV